MMAKISINEAEKLGHSCRDALDGNLLVGSFAAELVGESYPFSKTMSDIVFKSYTPIELDFKFADWMENNG